MLHIAQIHAANHPKPKTSRNISKVGAWFEKDRQRRLRCGDLSAYGLAIVCTADDIDPARDRAMAEDEAQLWDICSTRQRELATADITDITGQASGQASIALYELFVKEQMSAIMSRISGYLQCLSDNTGAPELNFHACRRLLAGLAQELEMLDLTPTQNTCVGVDGAFIFAGRKIIKNRFKHVFGWWNATEFKAKHNIHDIVRDRRTYVDECLASSGISQDPSAQSDGDGDSDGDSVRELFDLSDSEGAW